MRRLSKIEFGRQLIDKSIYVYIYIYIFVENRPYIILIRRNKSILSWFDPFLSKYVISKYHWNKNSGYFHDLDLFIIISIFEFHLYIIYSSIGKNVLLHYILAGLAYVTAVVGIASVATGGGFCICVRGGCHAIKPNCHDRIM